jgi:monoamine oxidase
VKRRKALKQLGAGLSAGLILPAWLSSCKEAGPGPEVQYDGIVGIIGAGASGLYVANILQTKGIKVKVFEASDRVGGRIRSLRITDSSNIETDFPIEFGAERIIGTDSLWGKIVDQLNVPVIDITSDAQNDFIVDGVLKPGTEATTDADIFAALNFVESIQSHTTDPVSVNNAIQSAGLSTQANAIINSLIGNKYGTSNELLGIQGVAESLTSLTRNKNERVLRSNPMHDILVSRFNSVVSSVELSTVVKKINYSGEKIEISGEKTIDGAVQNFSSQVDKVIIAVPISILNEGRIAFTPALPSANTTAFSAMSMDPSLRVVLDFKKNFWGDSTAFIFGGTVCPEYFSTGKGRSRFNKTLSMTINGPKATELSALGEDMILQILQELDLVYDGKATLNIRRDDDNKIISLIQDWSKEEFIKGGISYLRPGASLNDRIVAATPVGIQLFFAGEAMESTGEAGTISGALLSAERVAQEVVESIVNS